MYNDYNTILGVITNFTALIIILLYSMYMYMHFAYSLLVNCHRKTRFILKEFLAINFSCLIEFTIELEESKNIT